MELQDEGMCFACGENNPIGLKLKFSLHDNGEYIAKFTPRSEHQGYTGIAHGGIVSTLLDEAMARLVFELGYHAVTAEMQIKLKKPAQIRKELTIIGRIKGIRGRVIDCEAEIRNAEDELIASANGKMVKVKLPEAQEA